MTSPKGSQVDQPDDFSSSAVRKRAPARIVLAADDAILRRILRRLLEREHFVVTEVIAGPDAVELVAADPRTIHLVIVDGDMPAPTISTVVEALGALDAALPVLWLHADGSHPRIQPAVGQVVRKVDKQRPWELTCRVINELVGDRTIHLGE